MRYVWKGFVGIIAILLVSTLLGAATLGVKPPSPILAVTYVEGVVTVYAQNAADDLRIPVIPGCNFLVRSDDFMVRVQAASKVHEDSQACLRAYRGTLPANATD